MQRAQSQKRQTAHDEWLAPLLNKDSLRDYSGLTIADGQGSVDSLVGFQPWSAVYLPWSHLKCASRFMALFNV